MNSSRIEKSLLARRRSLAALLVTLGVAIEVAAREEPVQTYTIRNPRPEVEPQVDFGPHAPPPAPFPVLPVEQSVFRGVRHGFVNTTKGNLAFAVEDFHLPGRMPIGIRRVYDSSHSADIFVAPPTPPSEARWIHDLGPNWIFGYSSYLLATATGVSMVTSDGDVIDWTEQAGGAFVRVLDAPARHMKMQRQSATVIVETQLDGTAWTYTWTVSASGSAYVLTEIADRSNNKVTLTYDQGFLSRIDNTDGAYVIVFRPLFDSQYPTVQFPRHRIVRLTDSTGRVMFFDYDASGNLAAATDVRSKTWTYAYTGGGLTEAINPLGETYLNASYDGSARVASYEANAGPWDFAYLAGGVTQITDAFDSEWEYLHQINGLTTSVVEPTLGEHTLVYDASNNPISYDGPMGETATWTFDANHRPLTHKPAGTSATITYVYNPTNGWVNSITGLTGGVTTFLRDASGRVYEETDAYGHKTTATYAANGDRLTVRLPRGNAVTPAAGFQWSFTYDSFGNPATTTDPNGRVTEFEYTTQGSFFELRRPDHFDPTTGQVVKAEWSTKRDPAGHSIGSRTPLGNETYYSYDDAGRLEIVEGPAGANYRYVYDARHRLTEVWNEAEIDPEPKSVLVSEFQYNAAGRLETRHTATSASYTHGYDDSGRLISVTDPLDRTWSYERDLSGRVKKITWPSGRFLTLTRDAAGRITRRQFPGGRDETFTYDAAGQLLTASTVEGGNQSSLTWTRDLLERPLSLESETSWGTYGAERTLSFTYDPNGNRETLHVEFFNETTTYEYDALDRVTSAQKNGGPEWTVQYDQYSGHRVHVEVPAQSGSLSNEENWTYDMAGRVLTHQWSRPDTLDQGDVSFSYDAENRAVSRADSIAGTSEVMEYRADGLLESLAQTIGESTTTTYYGYDDSGNVSSLGVAVGEKPPVETEFRYDAIGRLQAARRGQTTRTYTWDDAPADLNSAFKVWRSPNDETERSLEIDYGYDGQLRTVLAHHIDQQVPEVVGSYLWSPIDTDLAMAMTERQPDGSIRSSIAVPDLGGLYNRLSVGGSGGLYLDHPLLSADSASNALGAVDLGEAPNLLTPLLVGWSAGRDRFAIPAGIESRGTGMGFSLGTISRAMQKESRPEVALRWLGEDRVLSRLDFIDDWSLEGVARRAAPDATPAIPSEFAQLSRDITPGWSSANPFSNACNLTGCGDKDADLPTEVCWGRIYFPEIEIWTGEGAPPSFGPPENCLVIWHRVGGADSCNHEFQYARSTGRPETYRDPDITPTGVSLQNGDFIEQVTDLAVFDAAGEVPFTRTYRSGFSGGGVLGPKWRHNWEESLDFGRDSEFGDQACGYFVRWIAADGSAMDFFWRPTTLGHGVWEIPPDSNVKLRVTPTTGTPETFEIRTSDGAVRTFNAQGELMSLQRRSVKYELHRTAGNIDRIATRYVNGNGVETAEVDRLQFTYSDGRLEKVENASASTQFVQFAYNSGCGELESAIHPSTQLGYDKTGNLITQSPAPAPKTSYTYANMDIACVLGNGAGYHMLATINEAQHNPLNPSEPLTIRRVSNLYGSSPLGAASMTSNRVTTQCFGLPTCDKASTTRRIDYDYAPDYGLEPGEDWAGFPYNVVIHDRRGLNQDIQERHHFYQDRLRFITEDATGIARVTKFDYNADGLVEKITFPDQSCETRTYEGSDALKLLAWRVVKSREACNGESGAAPAKLTRYTYEWLTGQVLTETGPEAFPTGTVPGAFDPNASAYKGFTKFYFYDVHQSVSNYPSKVGEACTQWSIPCPAKLGNLNLDADPLTPDAADDVYWSGALVLSRVFPRDPDGTFLPELETKQIVSIAGRPIKQTSPGGVSKLFAYYANSGWELTSASNDTNIGPLASTSVKPAFGTQPNLTTKFAYSARGDVKAVEDPTCVRTENTLNNAGMVTERSRTAPTGTFTSCPVSGTRTTLTRERLTYDLLGRSLQSWVVDATNNRLTSSWSTYDRLGSLKSVTLNPTASIDPGESPAIDPSDSTTHLITRTCYDGYGRAKRTISPERRMSCVNYDSLGRPIETITYAALAATGGDTAASPFCGGDPEESGQIVVQDACPTPGTDDLVTQTTYDIIDQPFGMKDPNGIYTYRWYDQHGNLQFVSDGRPAGARLPLGVIPSPLPTANWYSESTYDLSGRELRARFMGRNGRTPSASGWLQVGWSQYDSLGRVRKESIALHAGEFVPSADSPTAPEDDLSGTRIATTETVYRSDGKVNHTVGPEGLTVTAEYDGFGRSFRSKLPFVTPGQDQVERTYDNYGRPIRATRTSFHPSVTAGFAEIVETAYDVWSRPVRITGDPGGPTAENLITTIEYDDLSRERKRIVRWVDAPTYGQTPDANDRVSETEYDEAGRTSLTKQRTATTPAETRYGYSRDGLMTSLTDAEGNTTNWDYTSATPGLARVQKMFYPSVGGVRQTVAIEYDKNGNPEEIHHRASDSPNAQTVTWTNQFQFRGRLLTQREAAPFNAGSTSFSGTNLQKFDYDDLGRIVKATDTSSAFTTVDGKDIVVENFYDTGGRLIKEDQQLSPNGIPISHKVESTYRRDGFRDTLKYPAVSGQTDRYTLNMSPDSLGRLGAITGPQNPGDLTGTRQLLLYEYLGGKVWKRKSGNGLEARYFETTNAPLYDHVGRLLGVRYVDGYGTSLDPAEFRYGYDRVGNRTYEQRRHETLPNPANSFRTRTYKSDLLGRLEKWKERALTSGDLAGLRTALDPTDNPLTPTDAEAWQLDKVGNWLTRSSGASPTPPTDAFVPNELNQYTQVTTGGNVKPFTFDWLGQLRQDDSKLQPQKYEWDMFGRLTRVIRVSNSTEIARYRYDALNRRVEKQTSSVSEPTTRYVYDGWRSIEERVVVSSTEQVKARYGFGLSLDEVIWMDRASGSGENPPPPIDRRYFFAQDGLGSVIAATDDRAQGQPLVVSERYTYGAYGERSVWNGTWSSGSYTPTQENASIIGMPLAFTGHRLDAETGLGYFRNRYYDPETGRFVRRDLIGYADGPNLYAYADSAPSLVADRFGLAGESQRGESSGLLRWEMMSRGGPGYCLCNYSSAKPSVTTTSIFGGVVGEAADVPPRPAMGPAFASLGIPSDAFPEVETGPIGWVGPDDFDVTINDTNYTGQVSVQGASSSFQYSTGGYNFQPSPNSYSGSWYDTVRRGAYRGGPTDPIPGQELFALKAMGSFAAGSVVGGVAGAQGLALYGAKTSATFVFYSNAWYKATAATAAAAAWAQANGGRLIQNTRWDVGAKTAQMGWDKAKPIVDAASAQFAMHAKGIVDVFHMSQGVRVNATWAEIEYLHLMFNPYVTGIVYHTVY